MTDRLTTLLREAGDHLDRWSHGDDDPDRVQPIDEYVDRRASADPRPGWQRPGRIASGIAAAALVVVAGAAGWSTWRSGDTAAPAVASSAVERALFADAVERVHEARAVASADLMTASGFMLDGRSFRLDAVDHEAICHELGGVPDGCSGGPGMYSSSGDVPEAGVDPMVHGLGNEDQILLLYGHLGRRADQVVVLTPDGDPVEMTPVISGRLWAVPLAPGESSGTLVFSDGDETEVWRVLW